jgi:hypothetical protein
MPLPGNGVTPTTSTVGKVTEGGGEALPGAVAGEAVAGEAVEGEAVAVAGGAGEALPGAAGEAAEAPPGTNVCANVGRLHSKTRPAANTPIALMPDTVLPYRPIAVE